MKKLFFIPAVALLAVLGMSFTNLASANKVQPKLFASDYIFANGNWQAVPEQNCTGGKQTCRVQFGTDGPIYDLYDEMDISTKKNQSDGTIIVL